MNDDKKIVRELKLTKKQELFCRHYVADEKHNAYEAAISAGYKENTAYQVASQNLRKQQLTKFIDYLEKPLLEKLSIDQEYVLTKLKSFCEAKITDYFEIKNNTIRLKDFSKLTDLQVGAVESIKQNNFNIEIKLVDKQAAVVNIGKHLNMFKEQIDANLFVNKVHKVFVVPVFDTENK